MASPCFADLLDAALARAAAHARRTVAWSAASAADRAAVDPRWWRPVAASPVACRVSTSPPAVSWGSVPLGLGHSSSRSDGMSPSIECAAPSPPPHELTADQRAALEQLRALGAALTEAFTGDQLRRQYRMIVLRCHPDRHAARPSADLEGLSAKFARASAAYRCLRMVVPTRR